METLPRSETRVTQPIPKTTSFHDTIRERANNDSEFRIGLLETTAMYLQRAIGPAGIKVTRLARGLPSGTDIEYADDATLAHSLESRSEIRD